MQPSYSGRNIGTGLTHLFLLSGRTLFPVDICDIIFHALISFLGLAAFSDSARVSDRISLYPAAREVILGPCSFLYSMLSQYSLD